MRCTLKATPPNPAGRSLTVGGERDKGTSELDDNQNHHASCMHADSLTSMSASVPSACFLPSVPMSALAPSADTVAGVLVDVSLSTLARFNGGWALSSTLLSTCLCSGRAMRIREWMMKPNTQISGSGLTSFCSCMELWPGYFGVVLKAHIIHAKCHPSDATLEVIPAHKWVRETTPSLCAKKRHHACMHCFP